MNTDHVLRLVVFHIHYQMSSLKVSVSSKMVTPLDTIIASEIVCLTACMNYPPFYNSSIKWDRGSAGSYDPIISLCFPRGQFCLSPCSRWINAGSFGVWKPIQNPSTSPPVGTWRLVVPLWGSASLVLHPRQYIVCSELGFVRTIRLQVLALGRSPLLVGNFWGCVVAPTGS